MLRQLDGLSSGSELQNAWTCVRSRPFGSGGAAATSLVPNTHSVPFTTTADAYWTQSVPGIDAQMRLLLPEVADAGSPSCDCHRTRNGW